MVMEQLKSFNVLFKMKNQYQNGQKKKVVCDKSSVKVNSVL